MDKAETTCAVSAIRAVIESWYRAIEEGDADGLVSLVTPDVIVKAPGLPPISGIDSLEQTLTAFLEEYSEKVDYEVSEIEISGELAFASIAESARILQKSGSEAVSVNGMHLAIFRRQPDGRWLLARDISSLID